MSSLSCTDLRVSAILSSNTPTPQGFDSCLVDYLHPRKFPTLGPIMKWTLRVLTGGALYGLYEFNTNDIGRSPDTTVLWSGNRLRPPSGQE